MKRYRLVYYFDVWGNRKDGYTVNNMSEEAIVDFPDVPDKAEILRKLKAIGFLKKSTRMASIVDSGVGDVNVLCFDDAKGMPVFALESDKYLYDERPYHIDRTNPFGRKEIYDDEEGKAGKA